MASKNSPSEHDFNKAPFLQAFTHSSYANLHKTQSNERLEFLGDAILSAIIAEALYKKFPTLSEGDLTKLRAQHVRGQSLAAAARKLGLQKYLRHSLKAPSEQTVDNLLEQAFEALIGATLLENGYEKTKDAVLSWLKISDQKEEENPKGKLQELLQPKITVEQIEYRNVSQNGPDHKKEFTVELYIAGKRISTGNGKSKKAAEEDAAVSAVQSLEKLNNSEKKTRHK